MTTSLTKKISHYLRTYLLWELLKGLAVTGRHLFKRKVTVFYPEKKRHNRLASRDCMLCAAIQTERSGASLASFVKPSARLFVLPLIPNSAKTEPAGRRATTSISSSASIGDELRVESEVLEVRPSKSRPDQGLIKVRTTTLNQHDEAVQISVGTLVVPRRASFQEISERFSPEPGLPSRGRVSSFPQATQKIAFNGRSTNTERSHSMKINAAGSPGVERNTQAFLEALAAGGGKPIEQLSPTDARAVLTGAQAGVKLDLPKADIAEKTVSVDGDNVDLTVIRPAGAEEVLPVFMFFHGGGWVLGDFPTHERLVRDLVAGSGAAAVFVNYTPSPEARYPTAINQAYAATKWVAEHGQEINVDGKRLAVVGNSVGGNMAAVVSLMAKDRGTPKIKYQVLLWPVTDANFENASYHQFAEGHFLTRNMMKWFWDNYTPDPKQRQDAYASPLQATIERLRDLPPALIQTAEMDVLRDEGEAYGRKLDAAGVDVTVVRYNGLIHDYGLLNALSQVPGVRSAILQASEELKKRLQ